MTEKASNPELVLYSDGFWVLVYFQPKGTFQLYGPKYLTAKHKSMEPEQSQLKAAD